MKYKIEKITMKDKSYPEILKHIYDAPQTLYIIGNKEILNSFCIGIVGCRLCSKYGQKTALQLSYELSKCGITIVSGLARGIDSFSHVGCLNAKGKTIAILGNGLDMIYPQENRELAKRIIENGGALLSEYPIGIKPEKNHFPARNRIISRLSRGIIVVEAKERSGSLITADFALEQGREVFVVPGNIDKYNSQGTNKLIQEGAKLITCKEDILIEL